MGLFTFTLNCLKLLNFYCIYHEAFLKLYPSPPLNPVYPEAHWLWASIKVRLPLTMQNCKCGNHTCCLYIFPEVREGILEQNILDFKSALRAKY